MWSHLTRQLVESACEEDLGSAGDITSALLPSCRGAVAARVVAREAGVVCGLGLGPMVCQVFANRLGHLLEFRPEPHGKRDWADGDSAEPGDCVAVVCGPQGGVLTVERTLLNFVGRMSGVATLTRRFVEVAHKANPAVRIMDTRKTNPGWRELDKYAVRSGGGHNHRLGLHDAVLIKDNHLSGIAIDALADELNEWLLAAPAADFVEVEVDSLEQLAEVCRVPAVDVVLLDNFSLKALREAVSYRDDQGLRGKLKLEASGGVTLESVADIASAGVDRISSGALTHSARCLDFGMDM